MSSSSEKKKKTKTTKEPSFTPELTSLPDDLQLSCFARVSRLHHPTLSLASKTFRSLMASPELYQTRSSLRRTESCLYVCLRFPPDPNPRWFTLCRKPNQTLTNHTTENNNKKKKKKPSEYALATLQFPHSPPVHSLGLVTIGSDIYSIGGSIDKSPSYSVSILDCRSHTWREAPSMLVARYCHAATVLDGKIYVAGGCKDSDYYLTGLCKHCDSMEVFDPKMQTWELVSGPGKEICSINKSATIEGKIYMCERNRSLVYEPKENSCEKVEWEMDCRWIPLSYCVVDNVLYSYYSGDGEISWYDAKVTSWREVEGVERLPKFARSAHVKLTEYGGKMAVFWDKIMPTSGYKNKMIWCAVIALKKLNDSEICGEIEWCDAVLMVPKSYEFVHTLSATV